VGVGICPDPPEEVIAFPSEDKPSRTESVLKLERRFGGRGRPSRDDEPHDLGVAVQIGEEIQVVGLQRSERKAL
jgi:hypothetical protein